MDQQFNSFLERDDKPVSPPTSEERTMAILSHVLCLLFVVGLIAPLIIYIIKKDDSSYIAAHAKESLNFQITIMIIAIIMIITVIGIFLLWVLGIISTILVIIATIKASDNKLYRYPFSIRLVK